MADLEAAARALFEHDRVATDQPWDAVTDDDRGSYRAAAATVLVAAGCYEVDAAACRLVAAVAEARRVLDESYAAGRTWIPMDAVRAALDLAPRPEVRP